MLTPEGCRARQQRLLREMEAKGWDLFLTVDYRSVYYLTGSLAAAESPVIFLLRQDGSSALVTSVDGPAVADQVIRLEVYSIDRCITDPAADAVALLKPLLAARPGKTCAAQRANLPGRIEAMLPAPPAEADDTILRLRKRKEADEIEEIRESLGYCKAAYRAARETIRPGLCEIDVYNAMYAAVVREAGTAVPFPGDFACGLRAVRGGGAPTRRRLESGDLYILDLFPAPHLYFGDTCRTFAVGEPSASQVQAWHAVRQAMRIGEAAVKPGVPARDVYRAVKQWLDAQPLAGMSFWHHAGHGIGFAGHEAPRIIPGSDDLFAVGDVFTLEPGVYGEALRGGIRLEDNYVLREDGLENLFDFPMEL